MNSASLGAGHRLDPALRARMIRNLVRGPSRANVCAEAMLQSTYFLEYSRS